MYKSNPPFLPSSLLLRALTTLLRKPHGTQPPLQHQFTLPPANISHDEKYRGFFDFRAEDAFLGTPVCPLSYHYLGMQRAQLALMMDAHFIYPVAGMVHVGNDMRQLHPYDPQQSALLTVRVEAESFLPNENQFVVLHSHLEQQGHTIVSCNSRYLAKKGRKKPLPKPTLQDAASIPTWPVIHSWRLDAAAGRRYAALSGDYNPIHLWGWSAKLFGFSKPIIQGMDSVARCEAALAQLVGAEQGKAWQLSVRFIKPIILPAQAVLHASDQQFAVMENDTLCLAGTFTSL
jgi:acyl dehydratase